MTETVREIAEVLERHGVGLRQGMAIYAIVEGRFDDAQDWLDALRGVARTAGVRAEYRKLQNIVEAVLQNPPDHIPDAGEKVRKPSYMMHVRTCSVCGKQKGVTAFKAGGGTLCKICRQAKGHTSDPGIVIFRCAACGKGFPQSQVNGDRLCERCARKAAA